MLLWRVLSVTRPCDEGARIFILLCLSLGGYSDPCLCFVIQLPSLSRCVCELRAVISLPVVEQCAMATLSEQLQALERADELGYGETQQELTGGGGPPALPQTTAGLIPGGAHTPAAIHALLIASRNERYAPEVLPYPIAVDIVLKELDFHKQEIDALTAAPPAPTGPDGAPISSSPFNIVDLYRLEYQRVMFMVVDFLRMRMKKIQKCLFDFEAQGWESDFVRSRLSVHEITAARRMVDIRRRAMLEGGLKDVPSSLRSTTVAAAPSERHVFQATSRGPESQTTGSRPRSSLGMPEGEASQGRVTDSDAGGTGTRLIHSTSATLDPMKRFVIAETADGASFAFTATYFNATSNSEAEAAVQMSGKNHMYLLGYDFVQEYVKNGTIRLI